MSTDDESTSDEEKNIVGQRAFLGYTADTVRVVHQRKQLEDALMKELMAGITKRLVIIHRFLAGNTLLFRDENLVRIEDPLQLYNADVVYFTNDASPGQIEGNTLFDEDVQIEDGLALLYFSPYASIGALPFCVWLLVAEWRIYQVMTQDLMKTPAVPQQLFGYEIYIDARVMNRFLLKLYAVGSLAILCR